jgi:hypothetical protein
MRNLARLAGVWSQEVDAAMEKVASRCAGCPATGRNVGSRGLRQVSLRKHMDDAVNRALQMDHGDFFVSHRPMTKQLGLVVVDERSTYGELDPVASRSQEPCTAFIENALDFTARRAGVAQRRPSIQ